MLPGLARQSTTLATLDAAERSTNSSRSVGRRSSQHRSGPDRNTGRTAARRADARRPAPQARPSAGESGGPAARDPDADRARRRLRRHRHEPAVHDARDVLAGVRAGAEHGERVRHPVARVLGADARRRRSSTSSSSCARTTAAKAACSRCSRCCFSSGNARRTVGAARCSSSLGVFGTALLFGDGVITPAISVLGAVEGLEIATPQLQPFVVGDHGRRFCSCCSSCRSAAPRGSGRRSGR